MLGIESKKYWRGWIASLIIFLAGVGAGYLIPAPSPLANNLGQNCIREPQGRYKFIDPLLLCGINTAKEIVEFKPLDNALKLNIFDALNSPAVYTVSIYFRDLTNGRWTGINEDLNYDPASLFKVPVMIAYLKEAEDDPSLLSKEIYFDPSKIKDNNKEFDTITPDNYYTVEQLIDAMIIRSDNYAKDLLVANIDSKSLDEVLTDIGLSPPSSAIENYQISTKQYALFFRILYSSTYLDREMSEKALELLSKTTYKDGLIAGLSDKSITVAHKFGQYVDPSLPTLELHDCGIIYYSSRPYLLCVMTKGTDLSSLQKIIQQVSTTVYSEVANNYR